MIVATSIFFEHTSASGLTSIDIASLVVVKHLLLQAAPCNVREGPLPRPCTTGNPFPPRSLTISTSTALARVLSEISADESNRLRGRLCAGVGPKARKSRSADWPFSIVNAEPSQIPGDCENAMSLKWPQPHVWVRCDSERVEPIRSESDHRRDVAHGTSDALPNRLPPFPLRS